MAYTVYYKEPRALFWKKIRDVEEEGFVKTMAGVVLPSRYFVTKKKIMFEVPVSCLIRYSKERYYQMVERLEKIKQERDRKKDIPSNKRRR